MDFSVLISVYKNEKPHYFREALNSVVNQTVLPSEIVIVQDGPLGPDLLDVINAFKNSYYSFTKIICLKENVGLGVALSVGILECTFELIARMDSDDICSKDRFALQIELLESHKEIDVCGMWIEEFNNELMDMGQKRIVPRLNQEITKMLRSRNPMNHVTVMFRKSKVLEVGNYEHYPYFEDYLLWAKLAKSGALFHNIQQVGVSVRVGNDMIGRRRGFEYLKLEYIFFSKLRSLGFISYGRMIFNLSLRLVRFLPTPLLKKIYLIFLRK